MIELNEKLNVQIRHLQDEIEQQERQIVIERESSTKMRHRLIQLENDYDNLNSKQNAAREILQSENYELKHEISILKEKLGIFK